MHSAMTRKSLERLLAQSSGSLVYMNTLNLGMSPAANGSCFEEGSTNETCKKDTQTESVTINGTEFKEQTIVSKLSTMGSSIYINVMSYIRSSSDNATMEGSKDNATASDSGNVTSSDPPQTTMASNSTETGAEATTESSNTTAAASNSTA